MGDWALYAKVERGKRGMFPVDSATADRLNADGYGIFWCPNEFRGLRRAGNLVRIRSWFAELDTGTKAEQLERIWHAGPEPSMIVESKNGYHVYYRPAGEATADNWKRIVRHGIIPALDADRKASDVCRVLRAPGHYHRKDREAFMVDVRYNSPVTYSEADMLRLFPAQEVAEPAPEVREPAGSGFWAKVAALDGREALRRLSGHWLVNGERFELREQPNGNANLWVIEGRAERATPCFVWADGRLGGGDNGGSIAAFIHWYGHSYADMAKPLRELFPEELN